MWGNREVCVVFFLENQSGHRADFINVDRSSTLGPQDAKMEP